MTALWSWIQQMDLRLLITGIVDVLLVAFVIYRVLLLIRGTRAAYMVAGLLTVAMAYWGAKQLALSTVIWLLDHLINYGLIIVIIVFQADIRRALVRIGRRLINPRPGLADEPVEVVATVAEVLARRRIGALVVFEREQELDEALSAGVRLDARLSPELLMNLFTPAAENPLHDGAVLLRGGVVARAGVLLPLSTAMMDTQFGTRHRAAVGVTEETDAVCLVVSEERGEISLSVGGEVVQGLRGIELRRALRRLLAGEVVPATIRVRPWERIAQTLLVGERRDEAVKRAWRPTGGAA